MKFCVLDKENDSQKSNTANQKSLPTLKRLSGGKETELCDENDRIATEEEIKKRVIYKAKRLTVKDTNIQEGSTKEARGKFNLIKTQESVKTNQRLIPKLNKICKNPFCSYKIEDHTEMMKCLKSPEENSKPSCKGSACTNPFCPWKASQKPVPNPTSSTTQPTTSISALSKNPFLSKLKTPFQKTQSKATTTSNPSTSSNPKNPFLSKQTNPFKTTSSGQTEGTPKKASKGGAWTNPFDSKAKRGKHIGADTKGTHAIEGNQGKEAMHDSKKKLWFPNPFEIPKVKTEEEKLDNDEEEQDQHSPSKPRFRQKTSTDSKIFTSEVYSFAYSETSIDRGIVSIEILDTTNKKHYQLVLRSSIGQVLFTGYFKKNWKILNSAPKAEDSKKRKPQTTVSLIRQTEEKKWEKCKWQVTFLKSESKDAFEKEISSILAEIQSVPASTTS